MRPEFDAVVVGAGLIGSACALALSRAGLHVSLIEARPAPTAASVDARALVLAPSSVAVFCELELWPSLAPHAHPITTIVVSDRGGCGRLYLRAADAGLDALGYACPAAALQHSLRAAAMTALGPSWRWASRYRRHTHSDTGVMVTIEDSDGHESVLTAALLIAADGSDSEVRTALGLAVRRYDYGQHAVVAMIEVARAEPNTAFEHFTCEGPLALIPCGGSRYVSVQCLAAARAADALALDDESYAAMLVQRFGTRLGPISRCGPRRAHALRAQSAHHLTAPRAVLIGNAANTVHPNAAQGLNLGLRDVAALATRSARGDPGDVDGLAAYAAARTLDHRRTVRFTDGLAQTFRSPLAGLRGGRRLALTVADLCMPLKRALILEASGLAALARARA